MDRLWCVFTLMRLTNSRLKGIDLPSSVFSSSSYCHAFHVFQNYLFLGTSALESDSKSPTAAQHRQWNVIIFHHCFGAASYLSLSRRQRWIAFYVSEWKTNKRVGAIKISWDLQMLLPCCASVTSSLKRSWTFFLKNWNNDTCRLQLTNFLLGFISIPHTAIFHHFSLTTIPTSTCWDVRNSMFFIRKTNTTQTKRTNEQKMEKKERKSFVFGAEEMFPRDKF